MNLHKWLQPGYNPSAGKKAKGKGEKHPLHLPKKYRSFNARGGPPHHDQGEAKEVDDREEDPSERKDAEIPPEG